MAEFVGSMPWLSLERGVILDRLLHSVKEAIGLILTDAHITSYYKNNLENDSVSYSWWKVC